MKFKPVDLTARGELFDVLVASRLRTIPEFVQSLQWPEGVQPTANAVVAARIDGENICHAHDLAHERTDATALLPALIALHRAGALRLQTINEIPVEHLGI